MNRFLSTFTFIFRSPSISPTRLTGSITTPLPMTHVLPVRRMPDGNEVQDVFLRADEDRVPGVVAALGADHDVRRPPSGRQ